MSTPDPVRAAAYLATRERLDAKRRTTKVKCVAPNRQCGSRCIPPEWNCRLKGEGADPHLAAVGKGSDPVAGLANVERGLTRLGKGVFKLSFSEIEGGRKALARGTAKLSPGDLKKKEEIKKNVDAFLGRVFLPAAAIVGAGLLHRGLKNFKGYRDGPGQQVDEATRAAIDLVRTNIPGYGARVRERRSAGVAAVGSVGRGINNLENLGPDNLVQNAGSRRTLTNLVQTQTSQHSTTLGSVASQYNSYGMDSGLVTGLKRSLQVVDGPAKRPSQMAYIEWHQKSLESFWNTRRTAALSPAGVSPNGSIFSLHAANTLLSRSFGIEAPRGRDLKGEATGIIDQLSVYFKTTGETIRTAMRESDLNPNDPAAVATFIGRSGGATEADSLSRQTLTNAVLRTDYVTQARQLYGRTVASYDRMFKRVSEDLGQAPSIDVVRNRGSAQDIGAFRRLRETSFYNDAVEAHSFFLGRELNLPSPVYGSYTATIARKAYHARFVATKQRQSNNNGIRLALTDTEALNAGIEIARAQGLPEPTSARAGLILVNEAYGWPMGQYQRGNALGEVTLVRGSATRQFGRSQQQPRRRLSFAQRVAALMRQRRPDGTLVYASREAAEAAVRRVEERNQMDARVDAYLLVRNDFTPTRDRKGKPCGKSFVPKQAKCSKPTTARYKEPEPGQGNQSSLVSNVGKAAAVAGVVAGGVLAAKNRRSVKLYSKFAPETMNAAITRLSQNDVSKAIKRVPKRFRPQAESLVGKAKAAMAYISADAQGYNLRKINNKSNFSVWSTDDKSRVMTVGSVGDTLVIFIAHRSSTINLRTENGRGVGVYDMQFTSDLGFQQKKGLDRQIQLGVAKMVKSMNNDVIANMPKYALLRNTPYDRDGLGAKRRSIYSKAGYKSLPGIRGNAMFATLNNGKVVAISSDYETFFADLIKGEDYDTAVRNFQSR